MFKKCRKNGLLEKTLRIVIWHLISYTYSCSGSGWLWGGDPGWWWGYLRWSGGLAGLGGHGGRGRVDWWSAGGYLHSRGCWSLDQVGLRIYDTFSSPSRDSVKAPGGMITSYLVSNFYFFIASAGNFPEGHRNKLNRSISKPPAWEESIRYLPH